MDPFEQTWKLYPKRSGDNPKKGAQQAWAARLSDGTTVAALRDGVLRYAHFCEATGKLGTEFVMQAKRFFGPDHAFAQEWAIPSQPTPSKKTPAPDNFAAIDYGTGGSL